MGNILPTQPSKTQRDRKKAGQGSVDTGKSKRLANTSDKPPVGQRSRNLDRHNARPRATNPFIIFFLRLRSKRPKEHVTVIARAAGKLWGRMTPEQRKKYVDLANDEKKRRQERKRKRKRLSTRSR